MGAASGVLACRVGSALSGPARLPRRVRWQRRRRSHRPRRGTLRRCVGHRRGTRWSVDGDAEAVRGEFGGGQENTASAVLNAARDLKLVATEGNRADRHADRKCHLGDSHPRVAHDGDRAFKDDTVWHEVFDSTIRGADVCSRVVSRNGGNDQQVITIAERVERCTSPDGRHPGIPCWWRPARPVADRRAASLAQEWVAPMSTGRSGGTRRATQRARTRRAGGH